MKSTGPIRATAILAALLCVILPATVEAHDSADAVTVLGSRNSQFTINGELAFLLGISYYGGLGASEDFVRQDLDDLQRHGFNWLRVWATWGVFENDVSAVNASGEPREPYLEKLQWLVAECDRRGIIVDVTLTRGKRSDTSLGAGNVPVHHQEPFRRGYETWSPTATDFLTDLRGAVTGGAAGWCLHNGSQRNSPAGQPRRSFDLRERRLFDQLDIEELKAIAGARGILKAAQ